MVDWETQRQLALHVIAALVILLFGFAIAYVSQWNVIASILSALFVLVGWIGVYREALKVWNARKG